MVANGLVVFIQFYTFALDEVLKTFLAIISTDKLNDNSQLYMNLDTSNILEKYSNKWLAGLWHVVHDILNLHGQNTYEPSLGIRWYLDAQMLPEYRMYFEVLFLMQPFICACLIYRFISPKSSQIAVSSKNRYFVNFPDCTFKLPLLFAIIDKNCSIFVHLDAPDGGDCSSVSTRPHSHRFSVWYRVARPAHFHRRRHEKSTIYSDRNSRAVGSEPSHALTVGGSRHRQCELLFLPGHLFVAF